MSQSLAVKYRPHTFEDVVEQEEIKVILQNQLNTKSVKNAYLFVGSAGCGKTTTARIFAAEINGGKGNPIEMDAASNSGVDDVRNIIQQAQTKSIDSEYKIFLIDECHAISNTGWQAFLKLIEEPPAKSIFIFCTTNPEKIPKTILSRVQRYDFRRISQQAIVDRLLYIIDCENKEIQSDGSQDAVADLEWAKQEGLPVIEFSDGAVEYIAKQSAGGMRDAITMMDKCLAFGDLTLENVVKALGTTDYSVMFNLTDAMIDMQAEKVIEIVEDIHMQGKDLKQFIQSYTYFLLDIQKYACGCDFSLLDLPKLEEYEKWLSSLGDSEFDYCKMLLGRMIGLNADIKYSQYPKADIEAMLLILCLEDNDDCI